MQSSHVSEGATKLADFALAQTDESKTDPRHVWLRLLLTIGLILGILLSVQSVVTYYQVTRSLIMGALREEAQRHVDALEREGQRTGIWNPTGLGPLLEEIQQGAPAKIAWVRVTDSAGHVLASRGDPVGDPLAATLSLRSAEKGASTSQIRRKDGREVLLTVHPLRIGWQSPARSRDGGALRAENRSAVPLSVEVALYLDSASRTFGRLRTNLAVSSAAALGLVASMILLWLQLPHYVRGKQLERQTELARKVQMDLLPAADAVFKGIDFAAVCVPNQRVGGDFYDIFSDDAGRIAIVVGDVSGKGLPASVVAGLLLGSVRTSGWTEGAIQHEASSAGLNELLRTRTSPDRFASMFSCCYEPESGVLRYVNAGHLPPLLVRRADGAGLEVHRLTEGGPVLGLLQGVTYLQGKAAVFPGDLLVLFSDGVVEAMSASGELFDDDRLLAAIHENSTRSPAEMRERILKRVLAFLGKKQAQDDLTLVVARFGSA
jgi:hypothetical protein